MNTVSVTEAVARLEELPTLPLVAMKILELAHDPKTSAVELSEVISSDQSLSAQLLKVANSAHYGFSRQITTVEDSVIMLGFNEVRNVALATKAFSLFAKGSAGYDRRLLWRHSLAAAMATEHAGRTLKLDIESAFVAGLLHDFGKVAFDVLYPEAFQAAVEYAIRERVPLHDAERETMGVDHAEAGALLAQRWNLPDDVVRAIQFHHHPEQKASPAGGISLTANLAAVGNQLAYMAGFGDCERVPEPPYPKYAAEILGFTNAIRDEIVGSLKQSGDYIDSILGES